MAISNHIEQVRERLRRGEFISEAAVSQGILLPTLHELGWPVFDTNVVVPEFSVQGGRVDFALCNPPRRPFIFIEVKRVGISEGADRQLFEYAFHSGVPIAVLTDGQEWSFYLPGEQGRYDERRVYKLDLLEREIAEAVSRLERYLQYERVCSGEALKSARADYQNVARGREIEATLPRAWESLLEEPDSLLLELLAEKVADLCGYKPDLDLCSEFLKSNRQLGVVSAYPIPSHQQTAMRRAPEHREQISRSRTTGSFSFVFEGKTYEAASAVKVMVTVFRLLAEADAGFLDRFASRKHGTKRRYIARNRQELYPGRPHLAEKHFIELVPGWYMGTNYSRKRIQEILDSALEVVDPELRSTIQVNVYR
ncbi:type I restriction-modification system restriction subunit HsdR family [Thermosynechococcus sp. NK55a]|uniref:type I restriction-modification system restriction subunit HsdR family n=1 Tax=Thermosynechococcus sp. NK55a TaxID=1394889 RepID=UPI0003D7B8BE|nr:type I restriction-modification system restriction subunit HsdR family [Thermosynechococcus sp. NK55a]AHB87882.1 type I restriction-modification system restriction subunit HsdR family [Thermosynechococcus sp. NK55a]